jgi:hypothetical protein
MTIPALFCRRKGSVNERRSMRLIDSMFLTWVKTAAILCGASGTLLVWNSRGSCNRFTIGHRHRNSKSPRSLSSRARTPEQAP